MLMSCVISIQFYLSSGCVSIMWLVHPVIVEHNRKSCVIFICHFNSFWTVIQPITSLLFVLPLHASSPPVSHHRLALQSDRGRSVRRLPSAWRRQLRPGLLLHRVPRKPHGVSGPGGIKCRRSQNLGDRPPLPDGRDQWWRLAGQAAAHAWPISFSIAPTYPTHT